MPRWWFKIVVTPDASNTNWRYEAFLFPNLACEKNLTDYQLTIPQLRTILHFDIFPNIIIDDRHPDYESDIAPGDFEEWAMTKWFTTPPKTGESSKSEDEDPGPPRKKKRSALHL